MMTHGEMIAYLQDTANAPESAGVDNEIFGEMVKHFTKLQEENDKLKDYRFTYDKEVWSPVELHRILDNYDLNWNGVCKEVEKLKEENDRQSRYLMPLLKDISRVKEEKYSLYLKWSEVKAEKDGLQQELKDVRKLELAHMDTIKKLKFELAVAKPPKEVKDCFKSLNSAWYDDESKYYSENFECEEPDDIPTNKLQNCNYRDLRIVWEWLIDGQCKYKNSSDEENQDEDDKLKDMGFKMFEKICELKQENEGLQKELQDVRKLELTHMDTIKKLKSNANDMSRYWECIMDFCHNPDNPDKDHVVQWCEWNKVSDEDKIELFNLFGFYEEDSSDEEADV